MSNACWGCGVDVDPLRAPARIVESRIVAVCPTCARRPDLPASRAGDAPAPVSAAVDLVDDLEARPSPGARRRVWRRVALAGLAAGAVAFVAWRASASGAGERQADQAVADRPGAALAELEPEVPPPPPRAPLRPRSTVDLADEEPLVHPLPGPARALPENSSRIFGAERSWVPVERRCGGGHCGVDIGYQVGTPVMVVRDGEVSRVVRYDNDRGGLYVRVEHDDGMTSHYFHLATIRDDLRPGTPVKAGEEIATLGHSGIRNGPAHLHFALSVRNDYRDKYFDPEPLLKDAVLLNGPVAGVDRKQSGYAPITATVAGGPEVPESGDGHAAAGPQAVVR